MSSLSSSSPKSFIGGSYQENGRFHGIPLNKEATPASILAESLITSISEITKSIACIDMEDESFNEIGCYLYRISLIIKELQITEKTPENGHEILEDLSKSINSAKDLMDEYLKNNDMYSSTDLMKIKARLRGIMKQMGIWLETIPSSMFVDENFIDAAVRSLSKEMQNADFDVNQTAVSLIEQSEPQKLEGQTPNIELNSIESDLYFVDDRVTTDNSETLSIPQVMKFEKSRSQATSYSSHRRFGSVSGSLSTLPEAAQLIEPLYDSFLCPLTKEIMEDPVTLETGVTYDRNAITQWFEKSESSEDFFCPITGKKLTSKVLSTNIAIKTTINQWKERNEAARIKVARAALSLAGSEIMVLEAVIDLLSICQTRQSNKVKVYNAGILPLLGKFIVYKSNLFPVTYKAQDVRCAVLELLRQLAQNDEEGKKIIADTIDISAIIKLLSSRHQRSKHGGILLLLELSESEYLCEKIGSLTGAILMLITTKYNLSVDSFASETAEKILKNLEKSPENIKRMAENGLLEPLSKHLIEGSEEMQIIMATFLGRTWFGHENKMYIAEKASPTLIKMLTSGNALSSRAAFKALVQISAYHLTGKVLIQAGILKIMADEFLTRKISSELTDSQKEAATILANILDSVEQDNIEVKGHVRTIASERTVQNIFHMLKNSSADDLNTNLIRILLCMSKLPKAMGIVVSVVKETESSYMLVQLIDKPNDQLAVAAFKLLTALSPYIGYTLADNLSKIRGQTENLIQCPIETELITERHAVSVEFLAKLPHQNLSLNLDLARKNTIPRILQEIELLQRSGTRTSRYASVYLEGLVGILVRFTSTLYEPQMLTLARNHNLTSVFTELLTRASANEVQRLSAIGLQNLSIVTMNLSRHSKIKRTMGMRLFGFVSFLSCGSSRTNEISVCPIHMGICSSQNTFCLVDANAIPSLLVCLENENAEVVEVALSAISTLLDGKVDVNKSVIMLAGANGIRHLLNVVSKHKQESIMQKVLWMIEIFLDKGGYESALEISQDRLLSVTLVSAFHHGNRNMRHSAEKILRHLDKMPDYSTVFTM